jgi:hypothetical protein
MLRSLFFIFLFFNVFTSIAQNKFTISGYVRDSTSGEELIGSMILIKEIPGTGASANVYGYYSLTIPEGNYSLIIQSLGCKPKQVIIELKKSTKLDVKLSQNITQLSEVSVTTEKKNENITNTQMGVVKLDMKAIEKVPVIFGEKDVLKTLQLTPGVKSAGEGNSGFYVRGGSADQNLILLDEATVYNASHLLGFFSVFNSDAIKDVTLYKGNQPSQFGGRLSSVLDIKMKDGNDKKFGVEGGIGIIASRLKIEGPIKKEKGSFMISARRTYADLFLLLSKDTTIKKSSLYFYDVNAKANYRINDKNRIYLSGYFGKDALGLGNRFGINWGNATGTFRWNHLFGDKLFSNTSIIFSNYDYNVHINPGGTSARVISRIQDWNLKEDFQFFPSSRSSIKFGFNSIYHKIIPGIVTPENTTVNQLGANNKYGWENALYFSHEYRPTKYFSVEYGLRFSSFSILGPGNFYRYDANGNTIDTTNFSSGQIAKTYFNPEPRVALNFILSDKNALKVAYSRNAQYLHLLSNSTSGNPTDSWIPSSNNVKPEIADQAALGYFRSFKENKYEFSVETYYKYYQNTIDYKDGAQVNFNDNVESKLLYGIGRAYGVEFFLKKKYGRLNGWIGYTLSRTEKKIDGINNGNYYAAKQDRTHDVSLVGIYELSKKWTVSVTFIYYTGNAITFPSGKYQINGHVVNYYTERNGYRMPAYNRMDIGFTWQCKKTEKFESNWNFSCYNAYGRQNPYTITFQQDPNDPTKTQAVQTALFRWVPSITYNFKF